MDKKSLYEILNDVSKGKISPDDAMIHIKTKPFEDIGFAKVDTHRGIRQGVPEVIFGQNKSAEHIVSILKVLQNDGCENILVTRLDEQKANEIQKEINLKYDSISNTAIASYNADIKKVGNIAVVSAGTSDLAVCEEAAITAEILGNKVTRVYDVGVAGLHRLLSNLDEIMKARVIIVVAGMEGALASVIGGLVDCPVIAVPTSVGYGASLNGIAALLSMLNSCASGVSVVNIDNGFGAGYIANSINNMEGIKE